MASSNGVQNFVYDNQQRAAVDLRDGALFIVSAVVLAGVAAIAIAVVSAVMECFNSYKLYSSKDEDVNNSSYLLYGTGDINIGKPMTFDQHVAACSKMTDKQLAHYLLSI